MQARNASVPLPVDVVCAKEFAASAQATVKKVSDVEPDDMILDIGPETAKSYAELIAKAKTVVWNGPVGVFEFEQFGGGTKAVAQAIADSDAYSLAGGGDTLAAIAIITVFQRMIVDQHFALGGFHHTAQHFGERRFPRAVLANHRQRLLLTQGETHPFHRLNMLAAEQPGAIAVGFTEVAHFQ